MFAADCSLRNLIYSLAKARCHNGVLSLSISSYVILIVYHAIVNFKGCLFLNNMYLSFVYVMQRNGAKLFAVGTTSSLVSQYIST